MTFWLWQSKGFITESDFDSHCIDYLRCNSAGERSFMLIESFIMRGFKNMLNMDGSFTEVLYTSKEIVVFPDDDEILSFIADYDLDRVEIVKSYRAV